MPTADLVVDLAAEPFLTEAFEVPVFAALCPLVFFAEPPEPDLDAPDFPPADLALAVFAIDVLAVPDFVELAFALAVFDVPDFAADDFDDGVFDELELFAGPPLVRDREGFFFEALGFPPTVSAAAPSAPIAAPVAAPLRISPATSITASITFSVVERPLALLPELFEVDDVEFFLLFCFVFLFTGMISSQRSY